MTTHRSTRHHQGEIVIKNIDWNKIMVYLLLMLNLGGEVYPIDKKRFDTLESKIEEVNENVNDQMSKMDRRIMYIENKQTSLLKNDDQSN